MAVSSSSALRRWFTPVCSPLRMGLAEPPTSSKAISSISNACHPFHRSSSAGCFRPSRRGSWRRCSIVNREIAAPSAGGDRSGFVLETEPGDRQCRGDEVGSNQDHPRNVPGRFYSLKQKELSRPQRPVSQFKITFTYQNTPPLIRRTVFFLPPLPRPAFLLAGGETFPPPPPLSPPRHPQSKIGFFHPPAPLKKPPPCFFFCPAV